MKFDHLSADGSPRHGFCALIIRSSVSVEEYSKRTRSESTDECYCWRRRIVSGILSREEGKSDSVETFAEHFNSECASELAPRERTVNCSL